MRHPPPDDDSAAAGGRPDSLGGVLQRVEQAVTGDSAAVSDFVAALGQASLLPLLLVPALIIFSPLSGIPVLPSVCGIAIALVAAQALVGRDHLWLPGWLLRRKVDSGRLCRALAWLRRPAGWIDRITARRLEVLVSPPVSGLLLAACMISGAVMPVLEVLPFTSSVLGAAISLMALGLLVRDGLLALAGLVFVGLGVGLIVWLVLGATGG